MNARPAVRVRRMLGVAVVALVAAACAPEGTLLRLRPVVPPTTVAAEATTTSIAAPAPIGANLAPTAAVPADAVSATAPASTAPPSVSTTSEAPALPLPAASTSVPDVARASSATAFTSSSSSSSVVQSPVADDPDHDPGAPRCHPFPGGSAMGNAMPDYARRMFELQNELRQRKGRVPLVWDERAAAAADVAAVRLAVSHELAHYTTDAPCRVLSLEQYAGSDVAWRMLAENVGVADSTPTAVGRMFDAYVASPEHLQNILDPAFDRVGIATYVSVDDGVARQWNAVVFAGSTSDPAAAEPPGASGVIR